MSAVWKWAMSEEVRDQLGMDANWRYTGGLLVMAYCQAKHIPLEKASVSMDQTGRPVLVGKIFSGYPCGEFGGEFAPMGAEILMDLFEGNCPTIGQRIIADMAK